MSKTSKLRTELYAAQVENFNLKNPIGTEVSVRKDSGAIHIGNTRSEAYIGESGYPVIFVDGISGCYLLDRVEPTAVAA